MEIENKLRALGYELPNPPAPAANYIGYVQVGNVLYIGGNIGRINGVIKYRGKVGAEITPRTGIRCSAQLRAQSPGDHESGARRPG